MAHHSNIHVDAAADDCRIVVQLDENCQLTIDSDTIGEFIEKLAPHRRHPRVAELFERLGRIGR
jgi:hypothetical protein